MSSLEHVLENEILPLVSKPGRYVGNELNIIKKDPSEVKVRWALVFPDVYELGMSYLGFEILYHILNREQDVAAERVFSPWIDFEDLLRDKHLSLFSLETKAPLNEFDIVGFTLQYELHFTNVLNILDLGDIPFFSKERKESHPLVIAGGPCAFNPEPMAEFIDAFVIGDGEEVVIEITDLVRKSKAKKWNREELLLRLGNLEGVYVPQFYEVSYDSDGNFEAITPTKRGVPTKIFARTIDELKMGNYPSRPVVPLIKTTHDRLSLEIMRGCTRGCRFCHAGIIHRPLRQRPVGELVSQALTSLDSTGYGEISLLSLSTADYCDLDTLLFELKDKLAAGKHCPAKVAISVPSLRPETFNLQLAQQLKDVKKSGLTLAPEAGTERLRKVINKTNTDEEILKAAEVAFSQGWNLIKLYFMIGLPTETEEDLQGIVNIVKRIVKIGRRYRRVNINLSISPFSPKPHTPFQWEAQNSVEKFRKKISFLAERLTFRNVNFKWREPRVSFLEAVMARGDRRLASVIFQAWQLGARFDAWTDQFDFDVWLKAFQLCNVDPSQYTRKRHIDEKLPWDHITKGIARKFLITEKQKADKGEVTEDCRYGACNSCGLMRSPSCQRIISMSKKEDSIRRQPVALNVDVQRSAPIIVKGDAHSPKPATKIFRLKYHKGPELRFCSHLDMVEVIHRAFRRAKIPLLYSQGFHSHPKISFGPPLIMGYTSNGEYLDFQVENVSNGDLEKSLSLAFPNGLKIVDLRSIDTKYPSLISLINRAEYSISLDSIDRRIDVETCLRKFLSSNEIVVERRRKNGCQRFNIRHWVEEIEFSSESNSLRLLIRVEEGMSPRIEEILQRLLGLSTREILLLSITRTGLFAKRDEELITPMEPSLTLVRSTSK